TDAKYSATSGGTPMRYSSRSHSLPATSSSTSTTNPRSIGWPQPTITWPWIRRSSMRYSSIGTRAPREHAQRAPAALDRGRYRIRVGHAVAQRVLQQRRQIDAGHDDQIGPVLEHPAGGKVAAARGQIGEDDARA